MGEASNLYHQSNIPQLLDELTKKADDSFYKAKETGRNRVVGLDKEEDKKC